MGGWVAWLVGAAIVSGEWKWVGGWAGRWGCHRVG